MHRPSRAISLPFRIGATGGIAYTQDPFKIYVDRIVTILLTRPGERVMLPTFGAGVQDHVFETADDMHAAALTLEVRAALEQWEPALRVMDVTPHPSPAIDGNGIVIDVRFQVPPDDTVYGTLVEIGGQFSEVHGG